MLETFIDFGTYKTRLGVFNTSSSSKDYFIEKKTHSNVNIEDINLHDFEKKIKELIQTTEKQINYHIKDLNVMLDLSNFIIKLLLNYKDNLSQYEKGTVKIYHIVNAGYTSWYKVAITMARKLKESYPNLEKINVNPISYKDWDSKTPRPYDSRLLLSNENDYDFKFNGKCNLYFNFKFNVNCIC